MEINLSAQGSIAWKINRLGVPTASQFYRVLGSIQARAKYFEQCRHERDIKSQSQDAIERYLASVNYENTAMRQGKINEDMARALYELERDIDCELIGFITIPPWGVGCSPDGLVGDHGMIEIKCVQKLETHLKTVKNGMPSKHIPQVQGGLWITGRQWCDFISFCKEAPPSGAEYVERVERDEAYIKHLERAVQDFARCVSEGLELPELEPFFKGIPTLF